MEFKPTQILSYLTRLQQLDTTLFETLTFKRSNVNSTWAKLCVMISRFDKKDYTANKMVSRTQTSKTVKFESSSGFIMNDP